MLNSENSPKTLSELQRQFKNILVSEKLSIKDGKKHLNSTQTVCLRTRLGIYHYAYFSRILETLEEDFPKVLVHIGKRKFASLARKFLRRYPSREPNIMELGGRFPKFLKEQHLNIEYELASFEWLLKLSQFAPDVEKSNLGELSRIEAKDLKKISFLVAPSVFLFVSNYPVNLKRINHRKKTYLLIFRKEGKLAIESLDKKGFELLKAIVDGNSLGQIERKFKQSKLNFELQNQYFSQWVKFGIISHWK